MESVLVSDQRLNIVAGSEFEEAAGDEQLLTSLGVDVVDRAAFEKDFLDKLAEQFNENEQVDDKVEPEEGEIEEDSENERNEEPPQAEVKEEISELINLEQVKKTTTTPSPRNNALLPSTGSPSSAVPKKSSAPSFSPGSSLLKDLLLRPKGKAPVKANQRKVETESEKKVRTGEMTPFGLLVDKGSPKKDSFLGFSLYLQNQKNLNKEFQEKRSLERKKQKSKLADAKGSTGDEAESDASSSENNQKSKRKAGKSKKKTKNDSLDMSVLFPKKRRKKPVVGTSTSRDPKDAKRTPGKSVSETTGIYMNESEDSDYIPPPDSDCSEDGRPATTAPKRNLGSSRKRKNRSNYKEGGSSDSDEDYQDSDVERPLKKRKKLTDDGDTKSYKMRVENWKNNEFRFTGEMHKLDGDFKIPIHLWESLYKYQKVGVQWLWELHQQSSGGILGDEMGLGKTIQVIAFLAGLACTDLLFRFSPYRGLGPSLIVCPATVMHQWVKEFHVWWPPFRVAILHESGSFGGTKLNLIRSIQGGKGIIVTTYAGFVNNQTEIMKHKWHYVIVDEGHKIRNPDAKLTLALKQIPTPHRLILSGSPLQNNLKELWSLFDFVSPGKLGTLPVFMEQFAVPITQGGYSNASDIQVAAAFKCATTLRAIICPYLLRRMKSDVGPHLNLPPKNEQVLFCKLTSEQREDYVNYLKSDQVSGIISGRHEAFVGLIYLRKICNHPHLYDGGPKSYTSSETLSRVPKNTISKLKSSLRVSDAEDEGSDIELDPNGTFGHWSKSGKMIVVRTLLRLWKQQNHKVLLFTQSRQMLCILENFVRSEKYDYVRLDGSTPIGSRQPLIEKFNEDPSIFVFILTTRVGGLGVNLTGANRVIIFDPDWNPSIDLQARERAWRIGQNRQVTIYRLITSGTIEEKIYHRQIFKQFLTDRVLKNPKQKRFFKSNDMMELFTLNEKEKGTETTDIFAGTGSNVKMPRRQKPVERKSGKFRRVPHLVKQAKAIDNQTEGDGADGEGTSAGSKSQPSSTSSANQDDYVLRKLFKKSGVEAALRHDKILDTNEPDYLIVEKEAERVAKDAVLALKKSREQCWSADSGRVTWTGQSGTVRDTTRQSREIIKKKASLPPPPPVEIEEPLLTSFFSNPKLKEDPKAKPISASELKAIIRARNRPLIEPRPASSTAATTTGGESEADPSTPTAGSSSSSTNILHPVQEKHMELLREIREFIAFQASVDGQASTDELISEFKTKLPPKDSPLFKQMLNELCTHRQVEGRRIWRLKPEFR